MAGIFGKTKRKKCDIRIAHFIKVAISFAVAGTVLADSAMRQCGCTAFATTFQRISTMLSALAFQMAKGRPKWETKVSHFAC